MTCSSLSGQLMIRLGTVYTIEMLTHDFSYFKDYTVKKQTDLYR
uniref:Uncharacterized protein n=1 Tax=Anguilla anguilla TaxID=7936 RepID=A0A0E9XEY6_ANGAN